MRKKPISMYFLRITRLDYNKKGYLQKWPVVTEIIALDLNLKRIVRLASTSSFVCAEVFEVNVEPDKTTSLECRYTNPTIFRFEDGWHRAYHSVSFMGGKDWGPPYLNDVWVDEKHRHLLIEYQI